MSMVDPFKLVDISDKAVVHRTAVAKGRIKLNKKTINLIRTGQVEKGDPLTAAEIACVLAVKRTHEIVPFCHPLPITSINAEFTIGASFVEAQCMVTAEYKTGVEMEALIGVTVALVTIWDMVKYIEKDDSGQYPTTVITDVKVIKKSKG